MNGEKKLKILQINSVCGFGSTGRIVTDLYKAIEEQGHECVIAYGRGIAPKGYKTIKIGNDFDNYMHVAKTRILDKHGFGSKKATIKFIEEVKKYDPDIIHLHNIHWYYINIEILFNYLKESGKKIVWTLHDCWAFTGHCAYFDYIECSKWKDGCYECPQKKEYPQSSLKDNSNFNYRKKKKLFNLVENMTIVSVSEWLNNKVNESFLGKLNNEVILNGIDINLLSYKESDLLKELNLDKYKIILGVSNIWDKRKGLNDFIKLSKILDDEYRIVLVGLNDEQLKSLPKNIKGIKRVGNINKLIELYSSAYIFFNASVEETFGLVMIEAMACGVPIIGYNRTAIPEIIKKDVGYIVGVGELDNVKKIINSMSDKQRLEYKNNCIKLVHEEYNKKIMLERYINLYIKLWSNYD